ncbi:Pre-mRNA-splicing factor SPF27 [Phyllosticta capitalensis]|uniref:Pre-mRNA-splicing factor SPF27 n=1 Tax=Phyllosticta capitalensis TaxID=121624 RepID=A0ABR1YNB4_9PEZI
MPLIIESHDSLPYIDAPPSPSSLAAASTLITTELSPSATTTPHASLPAAPTPSYPPGIAAEHARLAAGAPKDPGTGIDVSRYEALDAPADGSDAAAWRAALQTAYTSSAHLETRLTNLSLLERFGKNAWLVSNSQLEAELRAVEAELAAAKNQVEAVEAARRDKQAGVKGEMDVLEATWREGVARVVRTEAAVEGIRRAVLERRRDMAAGSA